MTEHRELADVLRSHAAVIASELVSRQYAATPELARRYGPVGRAKCEEDGMRHVCWLAAAVGTEQDVLWMDYVTWAWALLDALNIPADDLAQNLAHLEQAINSIVGERAQPACRLVRMGIQALPDLTTRPASVLSADAPLSELAQGYLADLLRCDRAGALRRVEEALASGATLRQIYRHVFQPTQREVGRLWQLHEISVAQEHYCTAATQFVMAQLYQHLFTGERGAHTLLATCVQGDLHELAARLVADTFEMGGWDTTYLGANVPNRDVVRMVQEIRPDVVAVSVTIVEHLPRLEALVGDLLALGSDRPIILVGGYPFNAAPGLHKAFGADGSASDAEAAVQLAERLIASR